ncbi:MAG: hypothetical protein ACI9XZ_004159, partial [Alphaproteobacteria bacterium]
MKDLMAAQTSIRSNLEHLSPSFDLACVLSRDL